MNDLSGLKTPEPRAISHDVSIEKSAEQMKQLQASSLLVEQNGDLIGIVADTDIVRKTVANRVKLDQEAVSRVMSSPIISLNQENSPEDAFDLMSETRVRHLAEKDGGKIIGLISVRDLLLYFKRQSEPKMGVD